MSNRPWRRPTQIHIPLLSLALLAAASPPARAADEIHWTITGPTSVSFDWRGASGQLRYGPTSAYGATVSGQTPSPLPWSSPGPFWEARLSGLAPDAVYHYSIGGGPDHLFRTPPPAGTASFVVYAEGDVGDTTSYARVGAVQSLVAAGGPAFVLMLGDLTYGNAHGQAAVDTHFDNVMDWSQDAAYMPAWGNHEWDSPGDDLRNYKGRFDLPNPQASPGAPSLGCCGEDWSWFDYGGVRFIAYPEPFPGAWSDWSARAQSLMDAAQADPAILHVVTYGHRPAYSSGNHPGDATLAAALDALGAAHSKYVLDLCGHSHDYERTYPQQGVIHVTVGVGGSTLEEATGGCLWPGGCPPPAWSAFRAMHHGALRLAFTPTGVHGQMICGPAGDSGPNRNDVTCAPGDVFDTFVIGGDRPPVVGVPSRTSVAPGTPLRLAVAARDPDGDLVTSLTADLSQLPAGSGATFTVPPGDSAGVLSWTPSAADTGSWAVTVRAANALVGTATLALDVLDTVGVPGASAGLALAIERVEPNPAAHDCAVALHLASASPARLELVDARGRIVFHRDLGALGPGAHFVRLGRTPAAAPGSYWLRLTQDGTSTAARVTFVR